jgi:hypothetical protein
MNSALTDSQERRGYGDQGRRFSVRWSLTAGHRKLGTVRGRVINVSTSGVLLEVAAVYDLGNIIEIEMSPSVGVLLRAYVQIARLHVCKDGLYYYGSSFTSMREEDAAHFQGLLLSMRRRELAADFSR